MGHVETTSRETLGEGPDLVVVMGWGNRLDGENERWFLDRLAADYRVHAFEIPTNGTDFERDYLAPVETYADDLSDPAFCSHSTGGLVVGHLDPDRAVYVSPWWAFHGEKLRGPVFEYGTRLPVARPFVPIDFERAEIGERVSDAAWERLPKTVSPAFVSEVRAAQETMPDPSGDVRVCCSLRDTVVGLQGIGDRVPADRVRLYDGEHEPFSAADRAAACEVVTDALDTIGPA